MNGKESSPVNMRYLPDEILLNCLARVSRLYYPALSLVSKRFRSLIASTELYKTRILINRTENCIYLCSKTHWFTPSWRPTRISNPWPWFTPFSTRKSIGKFLVSVQSPQDFYSPETNFDLPRWIPTTIGSKIYMIGGYINHKPSSRVFVMDCVSHTWHEAPSMSVARMYPHVIVLDGRIYVIERSDDSDSSNLIECFDLKTQKWENVPNREVEIRGRYVHKSVALEGNLYLFGDKNVVYKTKDNKWEAVEGSNMLVATSPVSCVVDNVLYCYHSWGSSRMLNWYDSEERRWRTLEGLEELPELPKGYGDVRLVNYGGKIVVFWQEKVRRGFGFTKKKKMIWCAEIAVERHNRHEIYGKVERCDVVLTVPKSCRFKQFIVATL